MDVEYAGNCSHLIDFDNLLKHLENTTPDAIGPTASSDDADIKEVTDLWNNLGYKIASLGGTVEWKMYFPNKGFAEDIVNTITNYANIKYNTAWVSRVDPGYCVAPHFDRMPKDVVPYRAHVHITDAQIGHIFYVGDTYMTNYKKGDIFIWKDPNAWHAGSNIGRTNKYMLNLY